MGINFKTINSTIAKLAEKSGFNRILERNPFQNSEFSKIKFKGAKLAPLEKDTLAIIEKSQTRRFNSQAERLKAYYESNGVPFLLPHEEWSDGKISKVMELFNKNLDHLAETKELSKETLNEAIKRFIPEIKGKVEFMDFDDLKKYLKNCGYNSKLIKTYLSWNSLALTSCESTKIFLKFENIQKNKLKQVLFKENADHELRHALKHRLQNENTTNFYKNNIYKCLNQTGSFNTVWTNFYHALNNGLTLTSKNITEHNMLEWIGSDSIINLHKQFDTVLNKCIEQIKPTGELNLGANKKSWKHFFNVMKTNANDEKLAYQSGIRFREYTGNLNEPTDAELKPLLYAEMEKFFAKKRIEANKLYQ